LGQRDLLDGHGKFAIHSTEDHAGGALANGPVQLELGVRDLDAEAA
jgi:hypothetical protein